MDIVFLIEKAAGILRSLGLSEETIQTYYQRSFNQILRKYQETHNLKYRPELMDELLALVESQYNNGLISVKSFRWRRRGIIILQEIYSSGTFQWKLCCNPISNAIPSIYQKYIEGFSETLVLGKRYKDEIISINSRFLNFIFERGIKDFKQISADDLREFLSKIHATRPESMDTVVLSLKRFFKYMIDLGIEIAPFWTLLSAPKSRGHHVKPALPQTEFKEILSQVNPMRAPGKRDFAILILAFFTGMRAVDIVNLKLQNIRWKENEIRFSQSKTGQNIYLPLHHTVRDAIADYILNERPKVTCNTLFLRSCPPYKPLNSSVSIAAMFRRYLKKSGLSHTLNDGRTFHGLRRSLGTSMVSRGVPVTTVSQVLGHQDIRPTRQYIFMDLDGLRKCSLSIKSIEG